MSLRNAVSHLASWPGGRTSSYGRGPPSFAVRASAAYIRRALVPRRRGLIRLALIFVFALLCGPAVAQTAQKVAPLNPGEVHISFAPVVKKVRPAVVNV